MKKKNCDKRKMKKKIKYEENRKRKNRC